MLSGFLGDMTVSNSTVYPLPMLFFQGKFSKFFKLSRRYRKNMKFNYYSHLKRNIMEPSLPFFIRPIIHTLLGVNKPWIINNLPLQGSHKEKKALQKRMTPYYKNYYFDPFNYKNSIWFSEDENFGEDWDCGSSHHQIEITYPLLDRRIIEFLVQFPVEHFYMDGLKRGLLRKAMQGILPEKIRLRFDKLPYSPDYEQINRRDMLKIKELLTRKPFNKKIESLLNTSKMISSLDNMKLNSNIEPNYWTIIAISVWIKFYYWLDNKENH